MTEINVTVVYALPDHQEILRVRCPAGASIKSAIQKSGICKKYPDINLESQDVGIYGLRQNPDFPLSDNDRIEIYRPLTISPTEARRLRARSRGKT